MIDGKPELIIGANQKFLISADRESILWCHPPARGLMRRGRILDGKPACGTDDQHCEVTIFLTYEYMNLLAPKTWSGVFSLHYVVDRDPISLSPCVLCPYCNLHVSLIRGQVAAGYNNHAGNYWNADGSLRNKSSK